jgi:hypothetical protein
MDETALLEALKRHWETGGGKDPDVEQEIYHENAVLEFPQSGERFEGVKNFKEWRAMYPADLKFHIRKITRRDDLVVAENLISYDGNPWMFTVNIMHFKGERVAHERIYIMEGWDAAEWREPWRSATPADPPPPAP